MAKPTEIGPAGEARIREIVEAIRHEERHVRGCICETLTIHVSSPPGESGITFVCEHEPVCKSHMATRNKQVDAPLWTPETN